MSSSLGSPAAWRAKDDAAVKACWNDLSDLDKHHGFTDYDLKSLAPQLKNPCWLKDHHDAHSTQTLVSRAFRALNEYRHGKRGRPRFKSWRHAVSSVEGKAKSCLVPKIGDNAKLPRFCWKGLEIPLALDPNDPHGYERKALLAIAANKWKYRRYPTAGGARGDQTLRPVMLSGPAYVKPVPRTRFVEGAGIPSGANIGPSTIAAVTPKTAFLDALCREFEHLQAKIALLRTFRAGLEATGARSPTV